MSFEVTKSPPALVVPSKPTPAGDVPLTSTEESRLSMPFTSFHVFERPIHQPAATIRRALSEALVYYYPIAGRVDDGGKGAAHHIACTGEGVVFVAAKASCTLQDVRLLGAPPAIPPAELALRYGGRCRAADPLLMVQVTEFACGGYVVAASWNHGVADAVGLVQFLGAVGELARGLPSPSVAPVRRGESLPDVPQLFSALVKRAPAGGLKQVDFAYCDFTVPRSFVNRVRDELGGEEERACGRRCTVFEVVTAAIWQCRARAIGADPSAPAPLVFTANVRKLVGAGDGYYGNCITSQVVAAPGAAVAGGAIADLVKLIRGAKERVPDLLLRGAAELALDDELVGALCGYNALIVSSWGGTGMDSVDFGGGRAARVLPNMELTVLPGCFPCLPCATVVGDGGANVVAFCVTEEHVQEFRAQLAMLR